MIHQVDTWPSFTKTTSCNPQRPLRIRLFGQHQNSCTHNDILIFCWSFITMNVATQTTSFQKPLIRDIAFEQYIVQHNFTWIRYLHINSRTNRLFSWILFSWCLLLPDSVVGRTAGVKGTMRCPWLQQSSGRCRKDEARPLIRVHTFEFPSVSWPTRFNFFNWT